MYIFKKKIFGRKKYVTENSNKCKAKRKLELPLTVNYHPRQCNIVAASFSCMPL